MAFSQPSAGGDQFDAKDYNGRLLIVYPKSFSAETPTAHGISPSADVDIVVVDAVDPATGMPKYFQNARLFGNLAKSVSRDLGGQVLGRLGQVPTQRGNPAWVLQNFTDADVALATPADQAYQNGQFKAAESPFQQPQGQPQQQAPAQQWQAPQGQPPAQQQWQAPPAQAAAPAQPQQQWAPPPQQQAPAAAPAQQWQAPAQPGPPAAPPPAPAPAGGVTPELIAKLNAVGIYPPPGTPEADILAIAATLPQ